MLTVDNSKQMLAAEKDKMTQNTFGEEIVESSQPLMSNDRPKIRRQSLETRISEVERVTKLPRMATTDRKSNSENKYSARHGEESVDRSISSPICREDRPNGHYKKEIKKPKAGQSNLFLGSRSTSCRGNFDGHID